MISIFTPTHNPKFLDELYESLKAQTQKEWEWVVLLNNGAAYENDDPRVSIHHDRTGNKNVGYLKRTACSFATGSFLAEVDHDDLLLPTCLEEIEKAFEDAEVTFVYSNRVAADIRDGVKPHIYDEAYGWKYRPYEYKGVDVKETIASPPYPQSISRIWFAPDHIRVWRKDAYWRVGGHNELQRIADDHDLMIRTWLDGKMFHIDKPLYIYRIHGGNTWLANAEEIQQRMWEIHDTNIEAMAMKWAGQEGLRKIDLCGGHDKPKGYESIDLENGDITANLEETWPLEDDSVGVLRSNDAIEHLKDPIHTMDEANRVLAHGGFFFIAVPSTKGEGAWCDPTHKSFWNRRSFRYYTEKGMASYINFKGRFQIIKLSEGTLYDGVPYVFAHLIAIKKDNPRFYGELKI